MSFETNRNYVYKLKNNKLELYRIVRTSDRLPDTQGRVSGRSSDDVIYPDETIANGLRVEYTSPVDIFVDKDPTTLASDSSETSWSNQSLTAQTSPDESSHLNLNRTLCLAVTCFVKASLAERAGDIQAKEYYMREFQKKVSDNESNKNRVFIGQTIKTYSVK